MHRASDFDRTCFFHRSAKANHWLRVPSRSPQREIGKCYRTGSPVMMASCLSWMANGGPVAVPENGDHLQESGVPPWAEFRYNMQFTNPRGTLRKRTWPSDVFHGQRRTCARGNSEGRACHARQSGMDHPTLRGGPDKGVPPRGGPDKQVPPWGGLGVKHAEVRCPTSNSMQTRVAIPA